jgi:gliding motility-associated-like protein
MWRAVLLFVIFFSASLVATAQNLPGSGNAATNFNPGYISIDSFPRLQMPFSVMAWINFPSSPVGTSYPVFSSSQGAPGTGYLGFYLQLNPAANNQTTLVITIGNGNGCFTPACRRSYRVVIPNYLINNWMHVAATMASPTQVSLYINGVSFTPVEDGNLTITSIAYPPLSQVNEARIGAFTQPNMTNYTGSIDELSVWSIALTAAQVRTYMCQKIPPATTGLEAYYRLDEPNAAVPVQDASTPSYNGSTVGSLSRGLSGAYIGDESDYTYSPGGGFNWTNSFSETFEITNPSTNVEGVHLYTVEDDPNHHSGMGSDSLCTPNRYHGVFLVPNSAANTSASFSVFGTGPYGGAWQRDANDASTWSAVAAGLSIGDTLSFSLANSREIITVVGAPYGSGLPDTIVHCDFPLTIQANDYPSGTITWQHGGTGNTTQVNAPGWYYLEATSNCAALVFNDSVYVMEDTVVVDTLVAICPGQEFTIGGQTFQDTGIFSFLNSNAQGCDTMYNVEIELGTDDVEVDTLVQLCPGESFTMGGNTFTLEGLYEFTIRSPLGCDTAVTLTVEEVADSILEIQPFDEVICVGQEATLRVFPMNPGLLSWSNNQTGASTTISEGGYYAVTFQGQCGEQVDSIFVEDRDCTPRVFIPSAFTPNGDGVNDRFEVKGDGISDYSIRIFNRWGAEVFYSTRMANAWDGTINGEPAPTGVYVYVVTIKGFQFSRVMVERGSLTLMR